MFKNMSLKLKILLLSMSGVVTIAIVSIILAISNFNSQEKLLKSKMFLASEDLSNSIQDQFYERYGDVKTFSLHFKNFSTNSREYINYLNQIVKFYGIYNLIMVCDLNGRLLSVNDEAPDGKKINSEILYKQNFSNTQWFKETLSKKFLEDAKKDFTQVNFQDAYFDETTESVYKEKVYSTTFSTFIYNSKGEPIGIISTHPNFIWVESTITRIYDSFYKANMKTLELTLLNKNGDVIIDYTPSLNNGKKDVIHDEKTLNKFNLIKAGQAAAVKLSQGEEGVIEAKHARRGNWQINAFKQVIGDKIVDDLGWKVLVRVDSDEAYSEIINSKIIYTIIFTLIFIIVISLSIFFSKNLANMLMNVANQLANGNLLLNKSSAEASSESQKLSAATLEQAASLQETVTAVNQISAMMNKTSEMADSSRRKSDENKIKVNEGKNVIHKMVDSISNIKSSNQEIMDQVLDGNKRISEIVKVIAEIESKTKVINEIVFQTKLLSFNASVEAARAGEHGRGFSVVAEEVGNLAQMSGNASKEISSMLESSINRVKTIIDQTKNNVENILTKSKETMKNGEAISNECASIFEQIFINSEEVNHLVYEIANSAQEQAKGVTEINHAMQELDNVTHQNSNIAQKTSKTAADLLRQSYEIEQMASHLVKIIVGNESNISQLKASSGNNNDKGNYNPPVNKNKDYDTNSKRQSFNMKSTKSPTIDSNIKKDSLHNKENSQPKAVTSEEVPSYNDPRFEDL
ncbi:hypothetical protein GCL60_11725 [Silvanigrella paludirubra]|uniref:Methyl-accepting transducer domain-containing protein n=1 Tax=Silvanigrella paludirubra TaxID=2499159 RepID=A0A6N6VWN1_9BACT|nr:methyl-accepting chemotaxis protein [Silvanigrella paludirubra]KAB8037837.1 hypothetical protein GCL60_11725 [Silvanigrella paludirubra]